MDGSMKRTMQQLKLSSLILMVMTFSVLAENISIKERCNILADNRISDAKKVGRDYTLWKTDSFYSEKMDVCILTEKKVFGVGAIITDLSRSIILDYPEGKPAVLLWCDSDGADSVILSSVKVLNGKVWNVHYAKWLDDGNGGLPRTLKTPIKPYTKDDCTQLMDMWIEKLN
jgi:hypothetical protein